MTIAIASQIAEWLKGRYDAEAAQRQNAAVLAEIERAVTRIEIISYDIEGTFSLDEPLAKPYRSHLEKRIRIMTSADVNAGTQLAGLTVGTKHTGDWVNAIFHIRPGSPALPSDAHDGAAAEFINHDLPWLAIYKRAIDPKQFAGWNDGETEPSADLVIKPVGGSMELVGVLDEVGDAHWLELRRKGLSARLADWLSTGELISVSDLVPGQTQVIIFSPGAERWRNGDWSEGLWGKRPLRCTLSFNQQRLPTSPDLDPVLDKYGHRIYSHIFTKKELTFSH